MAAIPLIGAGISGVGSLVGSGKQASATRDAAKTQADAATHAADLQSQAEQQALGFQQQQYGNTQNQIAPYLSAGQGALSQLVSGTQAGGDLLSAPAYNNAAFSAPDPNQVANTPAYQFALQQGQQALQRAQASTGITGGGAAKAIDQYSQGLASQQYGNAYNQALSTYNTNSANSLTNYQTGVANQQNEYNRLAGIVGIGQGAVSTGAGAGANAANAESNAVQSGASQQGNYLTQAASANAAGTLGSANAYAGAYQNIGNALALGLQSSYGNQLSNKQAAGLAPDQVGYGDGSAASQFGF